MAFISPRPGVRAGTDAARTRALLAAAHRTGNTESVPALEAQLKTDMAADYLTQLLSTGAPLNPGQIARLRGLLAEPATP